MCTCVFSLEEFGEDRKLNKVTVLCQPEVSPGGSAGEASASQAPTSSLGNELSGSAPVMSPCR